MNKDLRWFKKTALSGAWHAYVHAADEDEVRAMHDQEVGIFPHLAARYPGTYQVEELPADFVPPAPLDALEQFEGKIRTGELN